MDKSRIIGLYDQDQRKDITYPRARREVTANVVRLVHTRDNGEGAVIHSQLDESNVEDVIREQVAYYEGLGQGFEWKVYDYDDPPDLKERLAAHGFEVEEPDAIMVLDLDEAPEMLLRPVTHTAKRITDPEDMGHVVEVENQVWGKDFADLGRNLAETLVDDPEWMSVYVAYVEDKPVSAAWIFFPAPGTPSGKKSQFASLWGGSTLVEYRGRGLYTALLAVRAQEAISRQVGFLTVDASPMSRPILEKFGFEKIADAYECKWEVRTQEQK
jgi:GNAT superfamily N-acetyltransferase